MAVIAAMEPCNDVIVGRTSAGNEIVAMTFVDRLTHERTVVWLSREEAEKLANTIIDGLKPKG